MATEVFTRKVEEETYSENPNFTKKFSEDEDIFDEGYGEDIFEKDIKIESQSKSLVKAKKEFFEGLEDESLTLDACEKVNHDWGNK